MYEFQHSTDLVAREGNRAFETPLWVVGHSPFDRFQSVDEGHVAHLGAPRFVARWFTGMEPDNPADLEGGITWHDDLYDISLCELVFLDADTEFTDLETELQPWLNEAVMVIAVWRGELDLHDGNVF
jgi:hypothetical protein